VETRPIRHAKSGDVNIAYEVTGEGPFDLVLVHGFDDQRKPTGPARFPWAGPAGGRSN
jgi:hypothetical protein